MFVITFYSYKGGVGRTMALVNVAASLARRGKKVLIVDFDLEAPSLPNYGLLAPCASRQGLVDYIASYRTNGVAPNASEYVYKCSGENEAIWVMPSGDTSTIGYSSKLSSIDWSALYSEEKGYLLFEDLKQQWKDNADLGFDYVLIDSRTGHTDVGGICTRQLPDLVVAMFLPTMQNISGLAPIMNEVRRDKSRQVRPVDILFCASNVPDLDDEKSILSNLLDRAAEELAFKKKDMKVVHQYASLDVLSHTIFAIERPNSKLAKEYAELEQAVISFNYVDPDGALLALKNIRIKARQTARSPGVSDREKIADAVDRIFSMHPENTDIAIYVARIREMIGDIEGEISALTAAIESGGDSVFLRSMRARAYQSIGQRESSEGDLRYIIESEDSSGVDITTALQILRGTHTGFDGIITSLLNRENLSISALNSLSEFVLSERRYLSRFADQISSALTKYPGTQSENESARINLALSLIGSERFSEAIEVLRNADGELLSSIPEAFNLFIARWASSGAPDASAATSILSNVLAVADTAGANYLQCAAVLQAISGGRDQSCALLDRAISAAKESKRRVFSCRTYLYLAPRDFIHDCEALKDGILESGSIELELGDARPMTSV